jgi:hypothetical protein
VHRCHRIAVSERQREAVLGHNFVAGKVAKGARWRTGIGTGAHLAKIRGVPGSFIRVTSVAKSLEVGIVVRPPVLSWQYMINLNRPLVCGSSTKLAAEASPLENFVAESA